MTKEVRHLHKTNDKSFCGQDIARLLATFQLEEATCDACLGALKKHQENITISIANCDHELAAHERTAKEAEEKVNKLREEGAAIDKTMEELHNQMAQCSTRHSEIVKEHGELMSNLHKTAFDYGREVSHKELLTEELARFKKI